MATINHCQQLRACYPPGRQSRMTFYRSVYNQIRMQIKKQLDPFNLCPGSLFFWFLVPPFQAIGISILGLNEVGIYWRQQVDPNQTTYLGFKLFDLQTPMPLTMLTLFSCLGLVITHSANNLIEAVPAESPFNLTPRLSIFFPVFNAHTQLGFITIDFRHVEISLKQTIEPNETIITLFRFLDLYSPFPLQAWVLILVIGLFLTGKIGKQI